MQNAPTIRVGQPGADAIDLSEKVVVVTGASFGFDSFWIEHGHNFDTTDLSDVLEIILNFNRSSIRS